MGFQRKVVLGVKKGQVNAERKSLKLGRGERVSGCARSLGQLGKSGRSHGKNYPDELGYVPARPTGEEQKRGGKGGKEVNSSNLFSRLVSSRLDKKNGAKILAQNPWGK